MDGVPDKGVVREQHLPNRRRSPLHEQWDDGDGQSDHAGVEKKGNIDGVGMGCPGGSTCGNPHDADNLYTWSTASTNENGAAFRDFLTDATTGLNVTGFAGANGWRLPTLAELQSIVLDYACTGAGGGPTCNCGSDPCIDGTFDSANTQSDFYWSATSYLPSRTPPGACSSSMATSTTSPRRSTAMSVQCAEACDWRLGYFALLSI